MVRAYKELDFGNKLRMYRINGLDTHYAYQDLIEVVEAAGDGIDLIVVPKVNRPEDVYVKETLLTQIESYRQFSRPHRHRGADRDSGRLRQHSGNRGLFHRLEGFVYGPGDYAASVRMPMESIGELDDNDAAYPGHRWHHIMHSIVTAARAYNKRAIDGPFRRHQESRGLDASLQDRASHGLRRQMVHSSSQIETVNRVPLCRRQKDIEWAQTVLREYDSLGKRGSPLSVKGK